MPKPLGMQTVVITGATARRPLARLPNAVWVPLAVGSLLLAVGLIGLATGQPWLFPSLGPTAVLAAGEPGKKSSRFPSVVVGHLVGLAAALLAVYLTGASASPPATAGIAPSPARVGASVFAAVLTLPTLTLLGKDHAPAAATLLLVALGGIPPDRQGAAGVVAGVLIVATLGEALGYVRRKVVLPPEAESASLSG